MKVRTPQHFLLYSVLVVDLGVTLCAYKKESSAEEKPICVFQKGPSFRKKAVQAKILTVKVYVSGMFVGFCLWKWCNDISIFLV